MVLKINNQCEPTPKVELPILAVKGPLEEESSFAKHLVHFNTCCVASSCIPGQENVNTLPQATNGQGSTTPQRGRGGRGRGRGGLLLCYWCRDVLPKEQAHNKVAQCPYQKPAKDDWWKNQLSTVQGNAQVTQPNTKEN